jgi:DNA helicase-2/ATP-dependent DNA helicase PcrA
MSLTPEQISAVQSTAQTTICVAPAGAGKTRVLVERFKWLIDQGVGPDKILALTFTRRAAGQLRSRITELLGGDDAAKKTVLKASIGTVHGICLRIMEAYGDRLGYESTRLTVIDPDDRELLIEQCCRDLGFLRGKAWKSGLSGKKVERGLEAFAAGEFKNDRSREADAVSDIIKQYHGRLFSQNMLDFGLILTETRRLFADHPDVLDIYRERWEFVLVDEMQDGAQIEFNCYESLSPPANLFMVGDLRQSIYGFRYARPDLLDGFVSRPGAVTIDLRKSFRCGDNICTVANSLIANNPEGIAQPMVGASGRAGRVEIMSGRSADIAAQVIKERSRVDRWSDIAVLARSNRELKRIENVFREEFADVPVYRVGKKFDICDGDSFKLVHSMMRLAVNPRDEMAFLRFANRIGLGSDDMARLRVGKDGMFTAYMELRGRPGFAEIGGQLVKDAFAPAYHYRFGDPGICEWWTTNCPDMTVAQALDWYSLHNRKIDAQEDVSDEESVKLLTVHSGKGLEWRTVIVTGLNEGTFPSSASIREDGIAEERRVMFVGITRAAENLIIHYRTPEDQAADKKISEPSRFIGEMGLMRQETVCVRAAG